MRARKYLDNLTDEAYSSNFFDRMKRGISRIGLTALITIPIGAGSLGLTGCDSKPEFDISQYFGKNEQQIIEMLGEPSGPREHEAVAKVVKMERQLSEFFPEKTVKFIYRKEKSPLPKSLNAMELYFSEAGFCYQVAGTTKGYGTPEDLLKAIGLGKLEKEEISRDQLGFTYKMPPFELVQVHRPSSWISKYTLFNVSDLEAGNPR